MTSTDARPASVPSETPSQTSVHQGRRPSVSGDRRALYAGIVTAILLMLTLLIRQPYLFNQHMVAWGDDAVFGIEIDDAKHLRLLDGANSRIGTSHPGPAYFYVAGTAEAVLYDGLGVVPEPLNAQRIGYAAFASVMFGWGVSLLARRLRPLETFVATTALLAMMTELPFVLASSWLPHLYCIPFMLSVISAGAILHGERRAVVPYVVSSWFLVHGHVGFILNVSGLTIFVLGVLLWRHRAELGPFLRRHRRTIRSASLVSAVFLLPMVVNLFVNWPSPWLDYYHYSKTATRDPRSINDVLDFVAYFLTWQSQVSRWVTASAAVAVVGLVFMLPASQLRQYLWRTLTACAAALVLFALYATVGIDHLNETYTGYYILMVPAVVVAVGAVALSRLLRSQAVVVAGIAALVLAATLATSDAFITVDRGDPQVADLARALKQSPQWRGRTVVLTFEHATWPWAVGVMQYGSSNLLPVCAADKSWSWFVTERFICNADQLATGWHVQMSAPDTPVAGSIFARSPAAVLWMAP